MFFKKKQFNASMIDAMIVGLGNPESKYDNTRHNAGFMAVDVLCNMLGARLCKMKFKAIYDVVDVDNKKVLIVKPQTYMNNSGESVKEFMSFYKIDADKLVVISDDISLDVGKMRIRSKGSDGGQKGLRSIIEHIGTSDFARIKIGVGKKPNPDYDLAAWVLSKFKEDEKPLLETTLKNAAESAKIIINGEIDKAMNKFNS